MIYDFEANAYIETNTWMPTTKADLVLFEEEAEDNTLQKGEPLVKEVSHYLDKCLGCPYLSASNNFCLKGPMSKCERYKEDDNG